MSHDLPLPAQRRPSLALGQRGERVGVRGSGILQKGSAPSRRTLVHLATVVARGLTPFSPQAGRGDPVGSLLLALLLVIGGAGFAGAAELTFELRIENGRVAQSMRRIRVQQGDTVRLRWTTDRPILLHLHGYDIETRVEPGRVAETAFVAHAAGRFPVEEHRPDAKGGHSHGEAALVRIDVLPR